MADALVLDPRKAADLSDETLKSSLLRTIRCSLKRRHFKRLRPGPQINGSV
jgi:hypothetical protein